MAATCLIKSPCPHCEEILDSYLPLSEGCEPKAGDLTVCASCHYLLKFGVNGFNFATKADLTDLPEEVEAAIKIGCVLIHNV